jgi:stage II sporulation protein D
MDREASRRHLDSAEKLYFLFSAGYEHPPQFDTNPHILDNREEMKRIIVPFLIILTLFLSVVDASAIDTIKVLIVNEVYPHVPAKDEKIEKMGNVEGDLLVAGSHYSGNIEVWKGDGGLYLINELPVEEYVKEVVMAEVGSNWEVEALKVQAVLSRTYGLYRKKMNGNSLFHITSSVLHQAYNGNGSDARVSYAVEETAGEILTYNGKLIEPFYHSTSGGRTEDPQEVFGKSYPYLKPVEANCESSPYWVWERRIPLTEIEKALNISGIQELTVKSYTSTGRVREVTVVHTGGITSVKATDLRKLLGWSRLPSTNFSFKKDQDSMIFEGKGYGHGVGLCQWSALQMAREGKNYKEILAYFYPGTTIQLYESR